MPDITKEKPALKSFCFGFCSPYWIRIWESLHDNYGVEAQLVVWPGINPRLTKFENMIPSAKWLDWFDVVRCRFPDDMKELIQGPFDEDCQHVWINDAQLVYDQYHRWDLSLDLGNLERTEHFYQQLVFWNALLKREKPDFLLFRSAPHGVFDLIALLLARRLGIPHLVISYTTVGSYGTYGRFHLAAQSMNGGQELGKHLKIARWEKEAGFELEHEDLHPIAGAHLKETTGSDYAKAMPGYQRNSIDYEIKPIETLPTIGQLWEIISTVRKTLMKDIAALLKGSDGPDSSPILLGLYKEKGRSLVDSYTGYFARTRFALDRIRDRRCIAKLKKIYNHYVSKNDNNISSDDSPFVYVPLQFQPEESTNPRGAIFTQQLLLVNIIAHSIPENWHLRIKEHPSQFTVAPGINLTLSHPARNEQFYRILSQTPKVRLLPLDTDQFQQIDECQAVATVTGTTGWEAIIRKKPALIFGDTWYECAQGAFRIRNITECRQAIERIRDGIALNNNDLILMLKELEVSGFQLGNEFGDHAISPEKERAHTHHVARHFAAALDLSPIKTTTVKCMLQPAD